ncbi:MAG: hypothetical protein IT270_08650 [Saprospiraceae bacterium]|nr:hypothetical protein [Saprospiraceae bacterium]
MKQVLPHHATVVNVFLPRIYTIEANVILGSPSSGCRGLGICKIIPMSLANLFPCPTYTAGIMCLHEEKKLIFKFNISSLDDHALKNHFNNPYFTVVETFNMPLKVCNVFGVKSMRIMPGNYAIWQHGEMLQFAVDWEF